MAWLLYSYFLSRAQPCAALQLLSILAHGEGPPGWPLFLAITPFTEHFSTLLQDAATILTAMRDTAVTPRGYLFGRIRAW